MARLADQRTNFEFSLAIGIGANTAIFSLANAVLLRPLPISQSERVVTITSARDAFPVSYPNYKDFRDCNQVLSGLLCWGELPLSLGLDEQTVQVATSPTPITLARRHFDCRR